jgi:hypothetical protein
VDIGNDLVFWKFLTVFNGKALGEQGVYVEGGKISGGAF